MELISLALTGLNMKLSTNTETSRRQINANEKM